MGISKSTLICYNAKDKRVKKALYSMSNQTRRSVSILAPTINDKKKKKEKIITTTTIITKTADHVKDNGKSKDKNNVKGNYFKNPNFATSEFVKSTWLYSLLILGPMGHGKSSTVYKVYDCGTNFTYALKLMTRKDKCTDRVFQNESSLLQRLDCDFIIKFIYAFADDKHAFILTECADTDLFNIVRNQKRMSEKNAKQIVQSLLQTFAYLHNTCQIAHRDLKPENVVFVKSKCCTDGTIPFDTPKIIDFGVATEIEDDWMLCNDRSGTPRYLAPERWGRHYGWEIKASDIWSIGILTYEIVTGKCCFAGERIEEIKDNVLRNQWQFPTHNSPSKLCMNFVGQLLSPLAYQRPSAQFALKHPWLLASPESETFQQSANEWNTLLATRPDWTTYKPLIKKDYSYQAI